MTISTILFPDICAKAYLLESTAGIAAFPGSDIPNASTIEPIVDAVPIVIQFPFERLIEISALIKSSSVIMPAFKSASSFQTPVPEPIVSP